MRCSIFTRALRRPGALLISLTIAAAVNSFAGKAGAAPPRTMAVVGNAPPAVSFIDPQTMRTEGTVALDADPAVAVLDHERNMLYVLHGAGRPAAGRLSVVDLTARRKVATFAAGANPRGLQLSSDGKYALAYCAGAEGVKHQPNEDAMVLAVPTASPGGAVRLTPGDLNSFTPRLLLDAAYTPHGSIVFTLTTGGAVTAFGLPFGGRIKELSLADADRMIVSADGRWVYVTAGSATNGQLHPLNVDTLQFEAAIPLQTGAQVAWQEGSSNLLILGPPAAKADNVRVVRGSKVVQTLSVESDPLFARRAPDGEGSVLVTRQQIYALSDDGELTGKAIPLQPAQPFGLGLRRMKAAKDEGGVKTKPVPGEPSNLIALGDKTRFLMTSIVEGNPIAPVAIGNMKDRNIEMVASAGRGVGMGQILGMALAAGANSALLQTMPAQQRETFLLQQRVMANMASAAAAATPPIRPALQVATGLNGDLAVAANPETNDITVLDLEKHKTVGMLGLGTGCDGAGFAASGKLAYGHNAGRAAWMETATGAKAGEVKAEKGNRILGVSALEPEGKLAVVSEQWIKTYAPGKAEAEGTVELAGAVMVAETDSGRVWPLMPAMRPTRAADEPPASGAVSSAEPEVAAQWRAIRMRETVEPFEAFLARYPANEFASLAETRINHAREVAERRKLPPTLFLYSPKGSEFKPTVYCDDQPLAQMGADTFASFRMTAGEHRCDARFGRSRARATVEMEGGETYYLRMNLANQFSLELVNDKAARAETEKAKPLPSERIREKERFLPPGRNDSAPKRGEK